MKNLTTVALDRGKIIAFTQFACLIGIATVAPLFHQQLITGPIVNATLFVATALLGAQMGIMVGLIPSLIALSVGTLPAPLAPMIPFIMVSNAIMIVTFAWLKEKNYWAAILCSSTLKFLFLYLTSGIVINLLLQQELAQKVAAMMSWPQLYTALAGGLLAYATIKVLKSN